MLAPTGELHVQIHIASTFLYDMLCILQARVKTTSGYNTTTHQTTPLLPRMLHFTLKTEEKLQSRGYNPVLTLLAHYLRASTCT